MGKKKGFDVVEDAHELANHNINPVYWFNRVTSFTVAKWKADKYFAPLFSVIYTTAGVLWLNSLNQTALAANKTFWSFLLDFSNSSTIARFTGFLVFLFLWAITAIATVQVLLERIYARSATAQAEPRKEQKKRYPKRPKNWK